MKYNIETTVSSTNAGWTLEEWYEVARDYRRGCPLLNDLLVSEGIRLNCLTWDMSWWGMQKRIMDIKITGVIPV